MITGFNHNIRYKNRIYHIQTEDSGPVNPHIITHLFVGGNIIASKKTTYDQLVKTKAGADLESEVKMMMEEQHKWMLRNLVRGAYDNATLDNVHHLSGPAPLNVDPAVLAKTGGSGNKAGAGIPTPPPMAPPPPARPAAPVPVPVPDLAAAALAALAGGPTPAPRPAPAAPKPAPAPVPMPQQLAPEVLAARALTEKPVEKPATDTIFGEDLISEKSLDEVILSYLSKDDG
ncbi:MAG: hypothetical protein AB2A00_39960 [Myxococcota bacterium]